MNIIDIDGEVAVQVLHRAGDVLDQLIHHGHAHVLPDHSPQQLSLPATKLEVNSQLDINLNLSKDCP